MGSNVLVFDDSNSVNDLANFISRAKTVDDDAALLTGRGTALAVYVPVLVPAELGQGQYTILAMRVHRLSEAADINKSYSLASIQDRLARMGDSSLEFSLPPAEENPRWAGISVPMSGWAETSTVSDDVLKSAAQNGIDEVAQSLPANPGLPVVSQIRQHVWSAPILEADEEIPAGAAFAMQALGFLTAGERSKVYRSGNWTRISNGKGHVLVRKSSMLG
ncbi:hypothetical protein AUR04nite_19360 [Glutamicibacter uratoxydans]|uniref:Uncharacterized protein n=1 Tax=Glutamicibacter uratoxydans TaxID=43667 RepID=A0A4Y4DR53_GLUUR|nr:hypothetical protein [Glutamicibacter uratoxydans]GED06404.1 hypothetical protein AUR04nite_19360 [Glutamicibacter uratoxydans]